MSNPSHMLDMALTAVTLLAAAGFLVRKFMRRTAADGSPCSGCRCKSVSKPTPTPAAKP